MMTARLPGTGFVKSDSAVLADAQAKHAASPHLARVARPVRRTRIWWFPWMPLDQGSTGTCVPHCVRHQLMCWPTVQVTAEGMPSVLEISKATWQHDAFPENDSEISDDLSTYQYGTSVRDGMQTLKDMGFFGEFVWPQTVDEVIDWLMIYGSLPTGFTWRGDMFRQDGRGFIHNTGSVEGGHATLTIGWIEELKAFVQLTSWGRSWIKGYGIAYLSMSDYGDLMAEQGEVCGAVELKIPPRLII